MNKPMIRNAHQGTVLGDCVVVLMSISMFAPPLPLPVPAPVVATRDGDAEGNDVIDEVLLGV